MSLSFAKNAWDVFMLFAIPIGGGIPAGVVLAKSRGLTWPFMMALYFLSDVALACVFEPLMLGVIAAGKRYVFLGRFNEAMRHSMNRSILRYGTTLGPLSLVMIAFGVDPMTGRAVAKASGHDFVTGWLIAIAGDMIYFTMLMVSTIWLNNALGDGTWTTVVMLGVMFILPPIFQRLRKRQPDPAEQALSAPASVRKEPGPDESF